MVLWLYMVYIVFFSKKDMNTEKTIIKQLYFFLQNCTKPSADVKKVQTFYVGLDYNQ